MLKTKNRYKIVRFDNYTYQIVDQKKKREVCVIADYDDHEDAYYRAKIIAKLLNSTDKNKKVKETTIINNVKKGVNK